ncbi:hypothetical protein DM02DRAFT_86266 [Periconia macrospinosa]|uniref:Uncharacterized protein n=1 Tax=Periconia macrospinosa TaxID=97972 RepID=A0A2V1CWK4_9PLEO|nr:hypothetical protein DM02DRAFT_86266 [Periconia macrospinosa]
MSPYRVLSFTLVGALVASLIWTMALGVVSKPSCLQQPVLGMGHLDHSGHLADWDGPTDPDGYPFPKSALNNPIVNLSVPLTQPPIQPGEVPTTNGPNCGDTVEVAKARGCKFDWTVNSWVPPMCVSDELTEAFVHSREWFVYEDEERTKRIPIESVLTGTHENMWVDWGYHVVHCEFAFKKLALVGRTPNMAYVGQVINEYHTDHCVKEILANRTFAPLTFQDTYLHRGFASCYRKA